MYLVLSFGCYGELLCFSQYAIVFLYLFSTKSMDFQI